MGRGDVDIPGEDWDYSSDDDASQELAYGLQHEGVGEPMTGPPVRRLIMYDVHDHAGLDDRIFVMMHMLSLASVANASLAFPSPLQLLGRQHGNPTAEWWDEYYSTDPPIHRFQDVGCEPGVEEIVVGHPDFVDALGEASYAALMDPALPLCLRVKIKYYAMTRGGKTEMLMNMGGPNVKIWTSTKVASIMKQVVEEVPAFDKDYNVAHIRLGDKQQSCVTPFTVGEAVRNLTQAHQEKDVSRSPWLIMSDGGEVFLRKLHARGLRQGLTFIPESDVRVLKELKDNYLRYTVLSCFCGGADIQLWNYKQVGGRCNLKRRRPTASARFSCRSDDVAFVRDAWGSVSSQEEGAR